MKKIIAVLFTALMLAGCASLSYQGKDGTQVTYARFLTSADTIEGKVGESTIKSTGQKIDTETITAILQLLGVAK